MTLRRVAQWLSLAVLLLMLAGLAYTPVDAYSQAYYDARAEGSTAAHWLGVDRLGRDFFSRLWLGSANTLAFAGLAGGAALVGAAGLLALERKGGRALAQGARFVAALGLALPAALVGLLVAAFTERGPASLALAVALAETPFAFRQLRTLWLEQMRAPYVEASRAIGGGWLHLLRYTVWPNLRPQLLEIWKLVFAFGILELSGLTYLGLSGDPNWAELGSMLREGQKQILQDPRFAVLPGLALCLALICLRGLGKTRRH